MSQEEENGALAPLVEVPSFSLGDYLAEAGKAIRTTMPTKAWVEAVVLEAKPTRAGLSLELIEPFAEDRRDARLRCLLWHKTKTIIETERGLPLDTDALKA